MADAETIQGVVGQAKVKVVGVAPRLRIDLIAIDTRDVALVTLLADQAMDLGNALIRAAAEVRKHSPIGTENNP